VAGGLRPRVELLVSGRIATLAGSRGFGWVEALAVGEGRVLAAGRLADCERLVDHRTRRLRVGPDHAVLPGLTDAHLHLADAALGAEALDLDGLDLAAALRAVARAHRARMASGDRDGWLVGRGWSLDRFGGWPTADALEAAAPGRPVALWSHDHHSRWANRTALARADLAASTPDPPGGSVERAADGTPTGILLEHACRLLEAAIPAPTSERVAAAVHRYGAHLASLGLVGCQDPGEVTPEPELGRGPVLYAAMASAGALPLRVHSSLREEQLERAAELGLVSGQRAVRADVSDPAAVRAGQRATVGWLKLFADGALGSRTAALLEPYADTGGSGRLLQPPEALAELVARGLRQGIVPQVHAIGDRAVRVALDAIEAAPRGAWPRGVPRPGPEAPRPMARLEHLQLVDERDLERFGRLGVAASVQPGHLLSDHGAARRAWPERLDRSYRWRTLAAQGVPLAFGTDAPVESPDPWPGIAVAATRRVPGTRLRFPGQEWLGLARSIRAATVDPALVAGEAGWLGRLTAGYRADLIVIPAGAIEQPPAVDGALGHCRPLLTLIDGEEVWRAPGLD